MAQRKRNNELRDMSDDDLAQELTKQREELRSLRFDVAGSKSKDSMQTRKLRRDIARISTELRRRDLTVTS